MLTTAAWGVWGAAIDVPARAGFPETLGYVVWALTMIPPCVVALSFIRFRLDTDPRSIAIGSTAGILGAGGQLVLFKVLRLAPAYLVFPLIALSPILTVVLALVVSRERTTRGGWASIAMSLVAACLLSYTPPGAEAGRGVLWVALTLVVFLAWGLQGFVISHGNRIMKAESLFFYMTATGLLLAPVAWAMTDLRRPVEWGFRGPGLAAVIQALNAVGALLLVHAFRYGKAIVVSPLVNAGAPLVTILLSLVMHRAIPSAIQGAGMALAVLATVRMVMEEPSG
jgi:drug/metabolite transporter (DMT)-like permease